MDEATLVARLALAAVFALAAIGKLADRKGTCEAAVELGATAATAPALGIAVPLVELATVALLLPEATARAGATLALGLLLGFSALIQLALARGAAPDCHCLGQLGGGRVGTGTLARNFALALLAGVVLVFG